VAQATAKFPSEMNVFHADSVSFAGSAPLIQGGSATPEAKVFTSRATVEPPISLMENPCKKTKSIHPD
jgi:hypothetical protein